MHENWRARVKEERAGAGAGRDPFSHVTRDPCNAQSHSLVHIFHALQIRPHKYVKESMKYTSAQFKVLSVRRFKRKLRIYVDGSLSEAKPM